jgi:hypothetical protein
MLTSSASSASVSSEFCQEVLSHFGIEEQQAAAAAQKKRASAGRHGGAKLVPNNSVQSCHALQTRMAWEEHHERPGYEV